MHNNGFHLTVICNTCEYSPFQYIYIYILKLKFSLEMFWTKVTCGALRGRFRFLKLLFLSAAFSLMILGNIFLTLFDVYGETWMRGWREQRKINAQGQTNIHLDTGAKIWAFFSFTVKKKNKQLIWSQPSYRLSLYLVELSLAYAADQVVGQQVIPFKPYRPPTAHNVVHKLPHSIVDKVVSIKQCILFCPC